MGSRVFWSAQGFTLCTSKHRDVDQIRLPFQSLTPYMPLPLSLRPAARSLRWCLSNKPRQGSNPGSYRCRIRPLDSYTSGVTCCCGDSQAGTPWLSTLQRLASTLADPLAVVHSTNQGVGMKVVRHVSWQTLQASEILTLVLSHSSSGAHLPVKSRFLGPCCTCGSSASMVVLVSEIIMWL